MVPLQIGGRTEGSFDRAVLGRAKRQAERCIKQGVPYQVFNKWFRDRKKRIVPVEIVGRDEDSKPEVEAEEKKKEAKKHPPILNPSCVPVVASGKAERPIWKDLTEEWQRPLILRLFWYRGTRDELFIGCAMRDDAGHAMGFYRLRWRLDS